MKSIHFGKSKSKNTFFEQIKASFMMFKKFTKEERRVLSLIFEDLSLKSADALFQNFTVQQKSSRNSNAHSSFLQPQNYNFSLINKSNFLQFFKLPGLWGERLYEKLKVKQIHNEQEYVGINFDTFMFLISICVRGSQNEKANLLFILYDLQQDNQIDKKELITMLHSNLQDLQDNLETEIGGNLVNQRVMSEQVIHMNFNQTLKQVPTVLEVENFANEVFNEKQSSHLQFKEFKQIIKQFPRLLLPLNSIGFLQPAWASCKKQGIFSCLCARQVIENAELSNIVMCNDIMKIVILRQHLLYIYNKDNLERVIFLESNFIEQNVQQQLQLKITFDSQVYQEVKLEFENQQTYETWLSKLNKSTQSIDIAEVYDLNQQVGQGKFSRVYLGRNKFTQNQYAVKIIDKQKLNGLEREMVRSEIQILQVINHKNIIKLHEHHESKTHIFIIMEFVEGQELSQLLKKHKTLDEHTAKCIFIQLIHIIQYLQRCGIIHRDIKPENILVIDKDHQQNHSRFQASLSWNEEEQSKSQKRLYADQDFFIESSKYLVKITDFGLAKMLSPHELQLQPCGTLGYVAPEVLSMQGYQHPVDVWSLGVVLYLMLKGRLPFKSSTRKGLIQETINTEPDFEGPHFSLLAKDVMKKCLIKNPSERITIEELIKHPWINSKNLFPFQNYKKSKQNSEVFI